MVKRENHIDLFYYLFQISEYLLFFKVNCVKNILNHKEVFRRNVKTRTIDLN